MSVCANYQCSVVLVREHTKTCEINSFLVKVVVLQTGLGFFLMLKIVEKHISISTTTSKARIIFKPVDTTNFAYVTLAVHVGRALPRIKIVNGN